MVELSQIKDPADIRGLSREESEELADDIRTKIIQTVSQNGGHLFLQQIGGGGNHAGAAPRV